MTSTCLTVGLCGALFGVMLISGCVSPELNVHVSDSQSQIIDATIDRISPEDVNVNINVGEEPRRLIVVTAGEAPVQMECSDDFTTYIKSNLTWVFGRNSQRTLHPDARTTLILPDFYSYSELDQNVGEFGVGKVYECIVWRFHLPLNRLVYWDGVLVKNESMLPGYYFDHCLASLRFEYEHQNVFDALLIHSCYPFDNYLLINEINNAVYREALT